MSVGRAGACGHEHRHVGDSELHRAQWQRCHDNSYMCKCAFEREREQTKNGQDYPLLISNDLDKMSSDSCIPPRLVGTLSVIKGLNCLPFTVHMSVVATGPTLDMSSGHLVQLSQK